jgi:hypothetical protein
MKHELNYVSPESLELDMELESAICAASPKEGGFDDYEYEVLPEIF